MPNLLDLTLLPLFREAGEDHPDLPGLHIAEAPRRTARGRKSDRLILYLTLAGNAPLSPGKLDQILARLAQTYYKMPGSVTAALRTVAETLNKFLLDRNVRNASSGRQAVGLLTLVMLRGEQLYLAQSGPVHAFFATAGQTQYLYDPQISGRGLGLSRTTHIRYFQAALQPNDTMLLASRPSSTWSASTLTGIHGQGPESLRRRLVNRADIEMNAVLLQARPGAGEIHLLRFKQPSQPAPTSPEAGQPAAIQEVPAAPARPASTPGQVEVEEAAPPEESPAGEPQAGAEASVEEGTAPETSTEPAPPAVSESDLSRRARLETRAEPGSVSQPAGVPQEVRAQAAAPKVGKPVAEVPPRARSKVSERRKPARRPARPSFRLSSLLGPLFAVGKPIAGAFGQFLQALKTLLRRMLPGEALFTIPSGTMAFIAVAVPVVVVAVASMVYLQRGLAAQYEVLFQEASQAAQQAATQTDLVAQRDAWKTSLKYLDEAESYRNTPESQQLRAQVQSALDGLELIKRANYQNAIIGGLPDDVKVTRMVISDYDLYMLDGNSGKVLRGRITSYQDFEIDKTFQCGLNVSGSNVADKLIDIAPAPPGNDKGAVVLGMDANGNLLYCFTDKEPQVVSFARPATAPNWGSLVAFTLDPDQYHLYVLDPADKAVWAYWGGDFVDPPDFYFGDKVPPIQDVIDVAVDKRDLYLLHADGHMTLCNYSGLDVAPTRCVDPAAYIDNRPGKVNQPIDPIPAFSQVLVTQPPDPSLYLLASGSQAIYHFHLRTLNFDRQYLPANSLGDGSATAFTVDQLQRILYLAIGNRVYQANIP